MSDTIPHGYKMTEVGIIPDDWEVYLLEEISEKIMVGIASAATHAYRSSGIPMLRNQNIKPGYLQDNEILYLDPEYELQYETKRLRTGDLLTARTGYPGTTCIVPDKYDNAQSFTTLITRPKTNRAYSNYLSHYINSESGHSFFESRKIGGGQKNIGVSILRLMPIPLPPTLTEQRAIADALSDMDEQITALDEAITKKRDLKQGAMQRLLTGEERLPGFDGTWEVKRLDSFVNISSGGTPSRQNPAYWNGDIPWITTTQIGSNLIVHANEFITQAGIDNSATRIYEPDTLLIAMYGQGKTRGKVAILGIRAAINQACAAISVFGELDNRYLFFNLASRYDEIRNLSNTGNQENLNISIIEAINIPIPPTLDEQHAIATVLSDMDEEISVLEAQRGKTVALKTGMMQELLTGKKRLI